MPDNQEIINSNSSSHLETSKKRRLSDANQEDNRDALSYSSPTTPVTKKINTNPISVLDFAQKSTQPQVLAAKPSINSAIQKVTTKSNNCSNSQINNHNPCENLTAFSNNPDDISNIIPNLKTASNAQASPSNPKSVRFADESLTRSEVLHLVNEQKKRESERQYQEEAQRIKKQYESIGYAPAPVIPVPIVSGSPKSNSPNSRPALKINSNLRINKQPANTSAGPTNNVDRIKLDSNQLDSLVTNPKKKTVELSTESSNKSLLKQKDKEKTVIQQQFNENNSLPEKTKRDKPEEDVFSDEDSDYDPFASDQENTLNHNTSQGLTRQQPSFSSSSIKIDYFSSSVGVAKKEPPKKEDDDDDDDDDIHIGNDWSRIERMYELSKLRKEKIIEANMKLQQEKEAENDTQSRHSVTTDSSLHTENR